jgi:hypothetical protein
MGMYQNSTNQTKKKERKKKKRNGVMSFRIGHIIKIDSGAA